ncbi:MAG TPA: hypothetical protein VLX59_18140 [Acidimicrobiales bacterium]|nr:hypothetical protein [Acidimicrobiales bacterium]
MADGACVAFAGPTGRWGLAGRSPVEDVTYQNRWGRPLDFPVNGPSGPDRRQLRR